MRAPCAATALAFAWITAAPAAAVQDPVESLLRLHHEQRVAHVLGEEGLLTRRFAEPLTEVGRGVVRTLTREEAGARFAGYFAAVRFLEWEDVRPPRIRLSDDGGWAEVVVRKRVRTLPADGAGPAGAWRFAWVERWALGADGWRLHTMVSTERDDGDSADAGARARAYEILARARAAVGGEEAVAGVATLRFVAECSGPGGPFVTAVASARDGRVSFVQRTAAGAFGMGVDLAGPWAGAEGEGVDSLSPVESSLVTAHELHLLALAPEARFSDPVALDSERLDGRVVEVVAFTDGMGARVRFYYDAETGRPAGFRPVDHTGRGSADILTLFDDWRRVGSVLLPYEIRILQGEDVYHYRVVEASTEWLADRGFRP